MERLPDPPGVPALVGTLAHRVLELLCQEPPRRRDRRRARALAGVCWPEMAGHPDFARLDLSAREVRAFKWRVWRAVEGLWGLEDPASVAVVATEQRVEVALGGVPFVGVVDRVDESADGTVATDYKSGQPPPLDRPGRMAEKLHQVLLYAAALEAVSGCRPVRARLLYLGATVVEVAASEGATGAAVEALAATWGTHPGGAGGRPVRPAARLPVRLVPLCGPLPGGLRVAGRFLVVGGAARVGAGVGDGAVVAG